MTINPWQRVHELEAAADRALMSATGAFGTEEFPRLLAAYYAAMKEASAMRLSLRLGAVHAAGMATTRAR